MADKKRLELVDAVRGGAIIAVVLGHVLRGLFAADVIDPGSGLWQKSDTLLYLVRMPLFAVLAGTLLAPSVTRRGRAAYIRTRSELITYQFLLWSLIQGSAEVLTGSVNNTPVTWGEALNVLHPLAHLWFLPFILMASTLVALAQPWQSRRRAILTLVPLTVLSLLTWGLGGSWIFVTGLPLILAVAVGSLLRVRSLNEVLMRASLWTHAAIALIGAVYLLVISVLLEPTRATDADPDRSLGSVLLGMSGAVIGIPAVVALITVCARVFRPVLTALAYVGRHSLYIYLAHILFTASTRIVLLRLGLTNPWGHLILGVAVGVIGSIALYQVARRVAPWLYAPPWHPQGRLTKGRR